MSRIGRKLVIIPERVKVEIKNGFVEISGPKGRLSKPIPPRIEVMIGEGELRVERRDNDKRTKAFHGLTRALLANMVKGVTEGFSKTLEVVGVGYRAELLGKDAIKFSLGYANPIEFPLPEGITAVVEERGTRVIIQGIQKEVVGETAAGIRKLRTPDRYKGKGIKYLGEIIKLKPGKAGTKTA